MKYDVTAGEIVIRCILIADIEKMTRHDDEEYEKKEGTWYSWATARDWPLLVDPYPNQLPYRFREPLWKNI